MLLAIFQRMLRWSVLSYVLDEELTIFSSSKFEASDKPNFWSQTTTITTIDNKYTQGENKDTEAKSEEIQ